jgi:hypothetical protein
MEFHRRHTLETLHYALFFKNVLWKTIWKEKDVKFDFSSQLEGTAFWNSMLQTSEKATDETKQNYKHPM